MKLNFITGTLMIIPLLLCGTACQKQNESEIHDTVVIQTKLDSAPKDKQPEAAKAAGGASRITIFATCGWTLECEDWFTVEPASGVKGISESVITTQPNNTGSPRKGTIILKAGTYTSTYTFTQAGL